MQVEDVTVVTLEIMTDLFFCCLFALRCKSRLNQWAIVWRLH